MIVEDGTGVTNSNSYVSLVDADAYHLLYDNTNWAGDNTLKETALILATQAVDLLYGDRYQSLKYDSGSNLLWPRYPFVDTYGNLHQNSIPQVLKNAVCEIALMHLNGDDIVPLYNTDSSLSENTVIIGELEFVSKYRSAIESETYSGYHKIELFLKPILMSKTKTISMHL
jgi:hypothetical protein